MLQQLTSDLWCAEHHFRASGLPVSSRMTVVRLQGGRLWLHSPVPMHAGLRAELEALGTVAFIVAPNKVHHLFLGECAAAFPQAHCLVAPGLPQKRRDLAGVEELRSTSGAPWGSELEFSLFEGVPIANETVWFHRPSGTLVLTDLCQWWRGDLPLASRLYAHLTGVRHRLAVPRTVRLLVKDRAAARASAHRILQWPFTRVVMAHNTVVDTDAHGAVSRAFRVFA
jgi:uncharacterized protein DUF4336